MKVRKHKHQGTGTLSLPSLCLGLCSEQRRSRPAAWIALVSWASEPNRLRRRLLDCGLLIPPPKASQIAEGGGWFRRGLAAAVALNAMPATLKWYEVTVISEACLRSALALNLVGWSITEQGITSFCPQTWNISDIVCTEHLWTPCSTIWTAICHEV